MKKQIKVILTSVLLLILVASLLSACVLGDFGESATLYKTYKTVVENQGYKAVSEEEFDKLLDVVNEDGKSVISVVPQLKIAADGQEEWILTFLMSDDTTKTATLPAVKNDVTPDPDPKPEPSKNDGKTIETAFTVAEATEKAKVLAENAYSDEMYYVKGYVTSVPKKYTHGNVDTYNFNFADATTDTSGQFQVYSALPGSYKGVTQGNFVTVYGYLQKFVNDSITTYEVAYNKTTKENPTIVKIDGTDTPSTDSDKGTTAEKAYTVPELLTAFANLGQNEFSDNAVFVKGKIIWGVDTYEDEDGTYSYMYIADFDADDTDENLKDYLYIEYFDMTNYSSLAVGDEVVMKGYIINYCDETYGTTELLMSFYAVDEEAGTYIDPEIISVKSNGSTEEPDPTGHNFPSYFTYGTCTDEGCNVIGRKTADASFKNNFKYTLTESQVAEYLAAYSWMEENVTNNSVNATTFYDKFTTFSDGLDNVMSQNQIAEVLAYISGDYTDVDKCDAYYYDMYDKYFAIVGKIANGTNGKLKSVLSQYVAQDDIDYAASMTQTDGIADINNEINTILSEYNTAYDNNADTSTFEALYERLVNQNNLLAEKYGYGKNAFMKYSYENEYARDYTPEQTKAMSNYVLQYIKPLYTAVSTKLENVSENLSDNDYTLIDGLLYDNLFAKQADSTFNDVKSAIDTIANYFKYLDNGTKVTFNNAVEDLFKTGNYFLGQSEMAFTYYLYEYNRPILYFCTNDVGSSLYGSNYYYASGFTFVHEFGHYYENIHNGNRSISMDFCETQSQGNEMLMTAWLANNNNSAKAYEALKYAKLQGILETVLSATAIDEFEQAAYSGSYDGFENVNADNYQDIYDAICEKFGISQGEGQNDYWMAVCFDSAAYYISYAMSALPSIEIYAKAVDANGGLDIAKNAYLTLFTDSSEDYNTVLANAGLHNAFEEDLYTYLAKTIK